MRIIECTAHKSFTISKCSFVELEIIFSYFKEYLNFIDNKVRNSEFKFNEFEKTNFKKTNFGEKAEFYDNKFYGTTLFEGIQNLNNTNFIIRSCNFLKYAYFNDSKLSHLLIDTTTFNEIASFQNTEFNTIEINRTLFEKSAFFDDMKINNIYLCSKITIRNIKQQLLRTDNKIDYDLYKAYELNAHKLELKGKSFWWFLNKDAIILIISHHFSNNGLNWFKALLLTFIWGFVFYSLFYWGNINDFNVSKIYFDNTENFLFGYTKYLIPTNIYNPLTPGREYVKSNWISFIIGKIIIAIGIYETIKSFRKYKK
ncbi:hypothetical protein OEG92_11220 [Polaribacter sejongensis]|uniref:hypothetical protein n=1 Tax=Polaribacter sejongensis TaxID=985043 RepID=UPI0035A70BB0